MVESGVVSFDVFLYLWMIVMWCVFHSFLIVSVLYSVSASVCGHFIPHKLTLNSTKSAFLINFCNALSKMDVTLKTLYTSKTGAGWIFFLFSFLNYEVKFWTQRFRTAQVWVLSNCLFKSNLKIAKCHFEAIFLFSFGPIFVFLVWTNVM